MPQCARNACRRWFHLFARRQSGVTVDGRWFCSADCVEGLARQRLLDARPAAAGLPAAARLRLGVWLRHEGVLSETQLIDALVVQRRTGLRLGAQLQVLGYASASAVLRGLGQQAGVAYVARIDPSTVTRAPGGFSPHAARALSLVPFCEPDHGRIKVACTAPVPRLGLAAFRRLTELTPEPYLVTDDNWRELLEAYGSAANSETSRFVEARDLSDAAATIAAAAATGGNARLTEARFDPYIWVRVHGSGVTHDVVLADAERVNKPCPAVSTLH